MICQKCGKENTEENKFCVHCGQTFEKGQTGNVNAEHSANTPQSVNAAQGANADINTASADFAAAQYDKQHTTADMQKYLQCQKAENIKKGVLKREKASSVIWLISGILQCLMFAIFMCQNIFSAFISTLRYSDSSFSDFIAYMPFPLVIILRIAIFITAVAGIKLFVKRKSEKRIVNLQQKTAILMLVSQLVICITVAIWDKLPHCFGFAHNSIDYFSADFVQALADKISTRIYVRSNGIKSLNAAIPFFRAVLIVFFALPVVSSLIEVINAAIIKKNKAVFEDETDNAVKRKKTPLKRISVVICAFVAVSSVYLFTDAIFAKIRSDDEERLELAITYGHLNGYNETSIDTAINAISGKICKIEKNYNPYFSYASSDPCSDPYNKTFNRYLDLYFPLTKEQKRLRYMNVSVNGYSGDVAATVSMLFEVNVFDDSEIIRLRNVYINNKKITGEEKEKFIEEYFGGDLSKLYDDGEFYKKYGKYISSDQTLFRNPEYGNTAKYTYKYSGTKDVYDYEVKGKILWLKVSITGDNDEREYYWVPVTD